MDYLVFFPNWGGQVSCGSVCKVKCDIVQNDSFDLEWEYPKNLRQVCLPLSRKTYGECDPRRDLF